MNITQAQLSQFDTLVKDIVDRWSRLRPKTTNWVGLDKFSLNKAFIVLVDGVNQLVNFAKGLPIPGDEKKAAVLAAANALFNFIIVPILPSWAKPFVGLLKNIYDSMVDSVIENMVSKLEQ